MSKLKAVGNSVLHREIMDDCSDRNVLLLILLARGFMQDLTGAAAARQRCRRRGGPVQRLADLDAGAVSVWTNGTVTVTAAAALRPWPRLWA